MQPEKTFKVGDARAAIFFNKNKGRNGDEWFSYSVHIHRRFEREPGEWESTSSFKLYQLPQVALVLQLATDYVAEREAAVQATAPNNAEQNQSADAPSQAASKPGNDF